MVSLLEETVPQRVAGQGRAARKVRGFRLASVLRHSYTYSFHAGGRASVAQSAELLICNQEVAGSTPAASSAGAAERPWSVVIGEGIRARGEAATNGQMAERPMASDCKSDGLVPTQVRILLCPFETAGVAQLAERRLSKPHVVGSIPITRSLGEIRHGTDGCQALPAMWRGEGAGGL